MLPWKESKVIIKANSQNENNSLIVIEFLMFGFSTVALLTCCVVSISKWNEIVQFF